ncbi:alpha/beta fold hydrolase [Pisciglobus halotolerans]|uniref:Pimeloyl-ACP methyl ester carboxylesterase n=1 Tax=Pisciglobus halotolerans TaxID=745365 RepID=A0A1I3BQ40_9LACT|nr:alpha/beta hydrolase [Pisciglobus halotolerans]SFH64428.1 Pimeloyl-ACP methyl ester carboxylesterase [Pisciglobus halotolerans]
MEKREHQSIETNGIKLHVVQQGPEEGDLVLLLHGFPEYWYGWHKQMAYLADKGFRVWAPDQRGYNLSDKPEKVTDYRIEYLVADIVGLIKASGKEKVFLIGHDWGGIVAWRVAREFPQLIHKLIILNAPHEAAMGRQIVRQPSQLLKSSYILFFQLRKVPERLLQFSNWKPALSALQNSSRKGTFNDEELQCYRTAWSQPNAMRSMINWYRANLPGMTASKAPLKVTVPTLVIWGAKDQFLGSGLADASLQYCENGQGILLGEATHWVQHEEPEHVNQLMMDFIAGYEARSTETTGK